MSQIESAGPPVATSAGGADMSNEFEYLMPSLGADMDEGLVIEWLVAVGDHVKRGQVIARVETEKSDIDIEIWHEGTVDEILVEPRRMVSVGTPLLKLHGAAFDSTRLRRPSAPPPIPKLAAPPAQANGTGPVMEPVAARGATVWASPLARHLAGERGIRLAEVTGSGPGGAIRRRDLDQQAPPASSPTTTAMTDGERVADSRSDRMRAAIATRMERSNADIPHYRLERDIDLAALTDYLAAHNELRPVAERVLPAAAFVRATAIAAARHPELNGTWVDGRFVPGSGVNVSVVVSLRTGGLLTPLIRDADRYDIDELMSQMIEFTAGARTGNLRSMWTGEGSTITVTNLGDRGADLVHGLISPPEVALVGFGRIVERPWVVDGRVIPRKVVTATLGADHRATDGSVGSRFLATLANTLENPELL
jgi:pyruvate dehydrogenase E2 component (dihydrolipoamide acetyltransferase)